MKKITKLLLVVLMACISTAAFAQAPKFAHLNFQEFVLLMPESDLASEQLEAYGKELQEQIESMQTEWQTKLAEYERKATVWTSSILEEKQKELQELQRRISSFQQTAQASFQEKQQELMLPIIEKARKTIATVAKRENFTYVFDISTGALSYFDEQQSTDLLPMVKKELNITKELPRTNR